VARPDFSRTTIVVDPSSPLAGDVVRFQVTLRNTGDAESVAAHLRVTLPHEGLFVDVTGLPGARVDLASRSFETSVPLPAGADRSFAFRVVAPRDAGGRVLSPRVSLQDFHAGASYIDGVTIGIGTRPATGGLVLGTHRITPAGLVSLGFLLAILVLWGVGRVRRVPSTDGRGRPVPRVLARGIGPIPGALAIVIALGFWTLFGSMAWRDWRSLSWPEAACTVLDRWARSDELLALRYQVGGVETISTGFDTGSRLEIGGGESAQRELSRWEIGATVPCWYDPQDPGDVVVVPGFGGAYLFALFPIPVFLFGLWLMRASPGRRRQ
jgi:uncharacterized repeat protein (TIGR01451 family)